MAATELPSNYGIGIMVGLVVVFASVLWSVLDWVWLRPKRLERFFNRQGIRGNPYRLFHGDMKEIKALRAKAKSEPMEKLHHDFFPRLRPFLHRTMKQYGKNCLMWEGSVPVVNIAEPEMAREVLLRYNEFQKQKENPIIIEFAQGLITYEGHKWAQHRKLLNPAFRMEKLKLMLPAFLKSCSEMVNSWEEKVSKAEQEIDVCSYLTKLSADTISRAAFGSSYEEGRRIFELINEQLIILSEVTQSIYFPGLRFLPTKSNKKYYGIGREIKKLLAGLIEMRKEGRDEKDDLLGLLMESNLQNGTNKKMNIRVTIEETIEECKLFYAAGQDTTSSLLIWTLVMLSKYQEWQSKAREEVLKTFGHDQPDFEGLNHLKIVNMIFHEVLRLYSPVIELRRSIVEDNTKLGNITLPRGTLINLPMLHIHHDDTVWGEDAKEFKPQRFSHGISKASGGSTSFLAFGWGPRICIGSNFAMIEAKLALSMILRRFSFVLPPSYAHAPNSPVLLQPQFGAPIIFRRL